jgi:NodT family efflux transporter outer membrane factor (OMF) lipoprotein
MTEASWRLAFGRGALLPLASALCLAGCDLAPKYHVPVTQVPITYKEAAALRPAQPADNFRRGAWWLAFKDSELDALEAQVDGANPTLAASLSALDQARALAAEAQAGLYPTLSLGSQINEDRQSNRRPTRRPGQPNQYLDNSISARASYEIDLWDKVANAIKSGRAAAQATAADLETTRLSLHAELADDYITLRGLDAQIRVLQDAAGAYAQALQITRNRFAGKIASLIDVTRAENQLDAAQAALTDTTDKRALGEHAIAALIGKLPEQLNIPAASWTLALPDISAGLPSALLERRPDVASAERQMAAANATIGVARAAFYPALSLNILYGLQDTGFQLFSLPNDFWALGPGVALPLFEGGLRTAEEQAAVAQYRLAVAHYRAAVLGAFQDVDDALAERRLLAQEAQQEDAAVAAARQTLHMTTSLYKDGADSFLDVVIAQTTELQSEQAATDLRTRRAAADVALIRALGGGWRRSDFPTFKVK